MNAKSIKSIDVKAILSPERQQNEQELVHYKNMVDEIVALGMSLRIDDNMSAERALNIVSYARDLVDKIEHTKKLITEQARTFVGKMNVLSKRFCDQLELLEDSITVKLEDFAGEYDIARISSEKASCREKYEFSWDLEDISQVPLEYLMVDEKKIKMAMKFGMKNIPGINISTRKTVEIRRAG